ncbi:DNA replication endonuclease-helicase Dna2 [Yamadazyma tenuis]|uniref:DNA replication endonuclease-helicase Dna2 n=1 Tax=Candida tenuis TaxID=2315449 RepID=UPI00279B471A|nr:DNA replication endonuclease-helicase Dna2 [Yamadazyma tenuis]
MAQDVLEGLNSSGGHKRGPLAGSSAAPSSKRKIKKTAYFFRPENRLTGSSTNRHDTSIPPSTSTSVLKPVNPNVIGTQSSDSAKEPELYENFVVQNQSSDESFEGIKWRLSPTTDKGRSGNVKVPMPSSSPLKNILDRNDSIGAVPDQAESMLLKYGSGFVNMATSEKPAGILKSVSDLSSEVLESKPSLQRARSMTGFPDVSKTPSLSLESSSKLKSWISKFDSPKRDKSPKREAVQKGTPIQVSSSRALQSTPNIKSQLLEDSDLFSDDEEILASFAAKTKSTGAVQDTSRTKSPFLVESAEKVTRSKTSLGFDDINNDDDVDFPDDLDFSMVDLQNTEYTAKIKQLSQLDDTVSDQDPSLSYTRSDLRRLQIVHILQGSFKTSNKAGQQLILSVKDASNTMSKLIVRGEYTTLNLQQGDLVHLVLTHPQTPTLVDDNVNIMIWHPDVLVSATTVSSQLNCPRKPILTDRLKLPGAASVPLLVGNLLHEIFQSCFVAQNWSQKYMKEMAFHLVEANLLSIFSSNSSRKDVETEIDLALPFLEDWFKKYYHNKGPLDTVNRERISFSVNKALDIEENIWSPMFGIKGKVDVTLEAQVDSETTKGTFLIPMEIKTGREYVAHHAQSSLYALLFKDRYDMDVNAFLLVYTKEKLSKLGEIRPSDLRSLVNLRNRISEYMREGIRSFPPVIKRSICDRCEVQTECMTIHHLYENGSSESSGLSPEKYLEITSHLDGNRIYKDFYEYWDMLITKEESLLKMLKKDLWVMTAREREESSGKALANMMIVESSENSESSFKFNYTLVRSKDSALAKTSLQFSQIAKYDRVIVSDEEGHFTIAGAVVTSILPNMIVLSADRRILNSTVKMKNFNKTNFQSYESVLHSGDFNTQTQGKQRCYRIDKDEMFHGMSLARYNVLNLLLVDGDIKRRQQIVNLQPPHFSNCSSEFQEDTHYNSDQMRAFNKVLSADDYCLILGMPGTGKTTLIAGIINHLVKQKKTILLTSYTHSAVDNILLKVKDYEDVGILRIGHPARVHRDLRQYCPQDINTYEEYITTFSDPPVVGVTCLGINDVAFDVRTNFDYCIIDEASQVSLPVSLGPLRFCDKFILVGDHNQLPPLVQHPEMAVKKGLSTSLFQFLNDKFPESVTELTYQYRMCEDIMKLSNVLIYNNMLKCGSESVANQVLHIPDPLGYKSLVTGDKDFWMKWVLNEQNRVIFLDHDLVPGWERCMGEKMENHTEALLIWQIVQALTLCGVGESSIGVMSLYRAQLRLLNKYMFDKENIEVMTADQFQGRDKDCVIISLVRSNKERKIGDLLQEWRRINVAITRSKSKLIILGSKSTLGSGGGIMKSFLDLVHKEKWMFKLPPNACSHYTQYDPTVSQTSQKRKNTPNKHQVTSQSKVIQNSPVIRDIFNDIRN